MNNNEIKFFVINTRSLWLEGEKIKNLLVTKDGLSLAKPSDYSYVGTFVPGLVVPLSLDRDACGVLYILDNKKKSILVYEIHNRYSRWLEGISFKNPVSIAVSDTNIYVIDKGHHPGENDDNHDTPPPEKPPHPPHPSYLLYCLARVNLQTRWVRPIDKEARIATAGEDNLYVLDLEGKEVFKIDWEGEEEITLVDEAGQAYSLEEPTDIASDREGNFYILEGQLRKILQFNPNGQRVQAVSFPFKEEVQYLSLAVESSDNIFLGFEDESVKGKESKTGETSGVVRLSKDIKYAVDGTYTSKVFDSTMAGCQWHRVVLEADIPANTRFMLSYTAADYQPGIDGPFITEPLVNPTDTLLNKAYGRYIRFKIELSSDETRGAAPLINSFKVYFPRLTYLRYLPGTYQENEKKREYLERFLSLFETFMSYSDRQIDNFTKYLDPAAVPEEFISWLSSWLAIVHDENWPLEKKRLLLQQAPALYKKRGTPRALSRIIELFYHKAPIIVEPFQFKCIEKENKDYSKLVNKLYGIDLDGETGFYRFTVLVPPRWEDPHSPVKKAKPVTATQRTTLQRILDTEKPAHTNGTLQVLEPWFYLDMHTYLEINTLLTKTGFVLERSSVLGRDTVIADREDTG